MGQVSRFLRKLKEGYAHYCPGCDQIHTIWCGNASGPNWAFNGDVEKPDFKPSVRIFLPAYEEDGTQFPEETLCHYFINDGKIAYCGDCQHHLNGQTIDLPELPDRYSDEKYN